MGRIMAVVGQSLAVSAEVGVVTNCTLVSITGNVALVGSTQRSVAIDPTVGWLNRSDSLDRDIERCKAMARVFHSGSVDTSRAVVKVGAGQALVADARNTLWQCQTKQWTRGTYEGILPVRSHRKWRRDAHLAQERREP